jgi:hypothetical protein
MISKYVHKFHDFLTLFMFYIILIQLDGKYTILFREHGTQEFRSLVK